jgi:hypothetical protein
MSYYFLVSNHHGFGNPDLDGETVRTDFRYMRSEFLKTRSFQIDGNTFIPVDEEIFSDLDFGTEDDTFTGLLIIDKYLRKA